MADEGIEARRERFIPAEPDLTAHVRRRKLERVEGIAARELMEPPKRGPGDDEVEPLPDQPVQRPGAQAAEDESFDVFELRGDPIVVPDSPREEDADVLSRKPTCGEGERRDRRSVEPLHVVHRNEHRPRLGQGSNTPQEGDGDGSRIGRRRAGTGFTEEERSIQRTALRRRHGLEHIRERTVEDVAEGGEGQPCLGLCRPRSQDA